MTVPLELVRQLREETGVSLMACRKALMESGGDIEKARELLRASSKEMAAKKADRALGAGTIGVYVHGGGEVAAMVHLACETDFVARNELFRDLAKDVAMHVAAMAPQAIRREDLADEVLRQAREEAETLAAGKPPEVAAQIAEGKLKALAQQVVLLEQPFIKDEERTVGDLISEATQKFGERIEVVAMARFSTRG